MGGDCHKAQPLLRVLKSRCYLIVGLTKSRAY